MKRGFLVVAENNNNVDYIKMAYVLALSLKATQTEVTNLSIITTKPLIPISQKYLDTFDKVIICEKDEDWKEKSKSLDTTSLCAKYYDVTPYDETIVLDTDMIFPQDISLWWDLLSDKEIIFTTNVKTFRGETINSDFYRKVFTKNNLPNLYTGLFYFKKGSISEIFFNTVNVIFNNWEEFYNRLDEKYRPDFLSADIAYAMAYKILELSDYSYLSIPTFTHMKSQLQNIEKIKEDWTSFLNVSINDKLDIKINNFNQQYPFHYHDKTFLTEDVIESYETIR